jgi:hypothetical protein
MFFSSEQHEGNDQPDEHVSAGEGANKLVEPLPPQSPRLHEDSNEEAVRQENQHGGGQFDDRPWPGEHLGEVEGIAQGCIFHLRFEQVLVCNCQKCVARARQRIPPAPTALEKLIGRLDCDPGTLDLIR